MGNQEVKVIIILSKDTHQGFILQQRRKQRNAFAVEIVFSPRL